MSNFVLRETQSIYSVFKRTKKLKEILNSK